MSLFSIFKSLKANNLETEIGLYRSVLQQSRRREFYGRAAFWDSYEGRLDVLALHMAPFFRRMAELGKQGEVFRQAMFDAMVDDFDVALREEGLTDSGVKHRIKPMIALFYERLKLYDAVFNKKNGVENLKSSFIETKWFSGSPSFVDSLSIYITDLFEELLERDLSEIATQSFVFPELVIEND